MKITVYTLFIISLLSIQCGKNNSENNSFSIDAQSLKATYLPTDAVNLKILNTNNVSFDSIVYYVNDKKIGKTQELSFDFTLQESKLGYQNIKALVFSEGTAQTTEARIEVVAVTAPKLIQYTLVNAYPHDIEAYTQGLEFFRDTLIESTGQYGRSSLRKTNVKTGEVYKKVDIDAKYFAEGITVFNNQIIQLTWRENEGFIYDVNTFKKIKSFTYNKAIEGWGLTNDGTHLYQSDGTEKIWKLNPSTLEIIDHINVYTNNSKIKSVNELEYINGKFFANVYQKSAIAIINPETGAVEGIINLTDLEKKVTKHPKLDVLNGIAYNAKTNTIFVTGKNWDKMFEIKLNE